MLCAAYKSQRIEECAGHVGDLQLDTAPTRRSGILMKKWVTEPYLPGIFG